MLNTPILLPPWLLLDLIQANWLLNDIIIIWSVSLRHWHAENALENMVIAIVVYTSFNYMGELLVQDCLSLKICTTVARWLVLSETCFGWSKDWRVRAFIVDRHCVYICIWWYSSWLPLVRFFHWHLLLLLTYLIYCSLFLRLLSLLVYFRALTNFLLNFFIVFIHFNFLQLIFLLILTLLVLV